ncbi:c-type cytochrome [Tritonibacter mobilis]|uniref:c-type cytochrome n=1 Tax=Tritonibacter mobilis TaxID=379347 RepID=UPI001401C844|nr:cytochrome c family protein [Tritonibacter mobilis]NHM17807.1 cytochrome c family protein [Tritonibacter mobilis]NHM21993.1 cytochrome c family protein [Tritonibacter mobilis]
MFDTMTLTKATAGFCGAFLVFLLGKWVAEELYLVEAHGEASYVIEVADAGGASNEPEVDFATLMAEADVDKGAKVFRKCSACHKVDGTDSTGPHLDGVVGRDIASVAGFGYSGALTGLEGNWTPEHLSEFLTKPSAYASGTTMSFAGLKKVEDRVNLIAYLESLAN